MIFWVLCSYVGCLEYGMHKNVWSSTGEWWHLCTWLDLSINCRQTNHRWTSLESCTVMPHVGVLPMTNQTSAKWSFFKYHTPTNRTHFVLTFFGVWRYGLQYLQYLPRLCNLGTVMHGRAWLFTPKIVRWIFFLSTGSWREQYAHLWHGGVRTVTYGKNRCKILGVHLVQLVTGVATP